MHQLKYKYQEGDSVEIFDSFGKVLISAKVAFDVFSLSKFLRLCTYCS